MVSAAGSVSGTGRLSREQRAFRRLGAAVASFGLAACISCAALAQSGGSGGGGGASGGAGGAAGGTGGTGTLGTGATGATPASPVMPRGALAPPGGYIGPSIAQPQNPSPTVPQQGLGAPQVPSGSNAEPYSPGRLYDPAPDLGGGDAGQHGEARPFDTTTPAQDQYPLSSGGGASGSVGGGTAGDQSGTDQSGQGTARRGTRNFNRGAAGADSQGGAQTSARKDAAPDAHSMEACMAVWDPTSHMTKAEWRETCRRTLKSSPMDMLGTP